MLLNAEFILGSDKLSKNDNKVKLKSVQLKMTDVWFKVKMLYIYLIVNYEYSPYILYFR